MYHLLKQLALHYGLSQTAYWHLRLVGSVTVVPALLSLYLALFGKQPRHSLWVGRDGRLEARPDQPQPPR